jgi:hypothetical protein
MSLAYLDAGTGSLIATAVVGGTAAAGVAVRSARAKMSDALGRKRKGRAQAEAAEAAPAATDVPAPADGTPGAAGPAPSGA